MRWLLDTNTLSELTKPRPFPALLQWLEANETDSALSAITIGELALGIESLGEGKKRRRLERTFRFLQQDYAGKILDFTDGVAIEWGRLVAAARKEGRNVSVLDSQIEATALHFGLMVVTRNSADFLHPVFNPWQAA